MQNNLQKISLATAPKSVLKMIATAREKKDGGKETLAIINKAIDMTHDYIVNLYFERAHIYQLVYMTERDKLEGSDKRKQALALKNMEKYIRVIEMYIEQNNLKRWFHRLNKYFGKIYEYQGNYDKALEYYKKSLKYWKLDPEVVSDGYPRNYELKGCLASALIMSGDSEKGLKLAKDTYIAYEKTKEGRKLKKNDYTTWAIWRTGCVIYAANGLIKGKVKMDKERVLSWLNEAEKILNPPKSVKVWADFQFRKDEITALRKNLSGI